MPGIQQILFWITHQTRSLGALCKRDQVGIFLLRWIKNKNLKNLVNPEANPKNIQIFINFQIHRFRPTHQFNQIFAHFFSIRTLYKEICISVMDFMQNSICTWKCRFFHSENWISADIYIQYTNFQRQIGIFQKTDTFKYNFNSIFKFKIYQSVEYHISEVNARKLEINLPLHFTYRKCY